MKALLAALLAALALEGGWRGVEYADCRRRAHPDADAFDLFIVGESTAKGAPYDRAGMSLAALVAARFDGKIGGRRMLAVTIAEGGQSIYPQAVALEKALLCRDASRPGAALFYTGHNDEGTAHGESLLMRAERVLPRSRILEALIFRIEMNQPALRTRTLDTWEFHLRRALDASRAAGLTPVLAVPISDREGVDPGIAMRGVDPREMRALALRARALERAGRCAELGALSAPAAAAAYLSFRLAGCAKRGGDRARARRLYQDALDGADRSSFGRATSLQVERLRAIAAETGTPLADASTAFDSGDLFVDAQHPNLRGYLLLADAYARALSTVFPEPLRPAPVPACGPSCQADALAVGGWWLLTVSSNHPAPEDRLALARRRFAEARALAPGHFSALLGRALADEAARSGLLRDATALDWLGRMGLFFVGPRDLDDARFAEVLSRLRAGGTPPADLAALERARRDGIQSPHAH